MPGRVRCRSGQVPRPCTIEAAGARTGRRHLHLPDASPDPSGGTRLLPDLRHGARAGARLRRDRAQSGARRHVAPVLGRAHPDDPGPGAGDGRTPRRSPPADQPILVEPDPVPSRDPGRALVRLAIPRAWLAIGGHPQSQHVHADRDGHRRGVALQRRRDRDAGALPGGISWTGRRRRGLFRSRSGDHRARPARAGPGAAGAGANLGAIRRCSTWRREPRGG